VPAIQRWQRAGNSRGVGGFPAGEDVQIRASQHGGHLVGVLGAQRHQGRPAGEDRLGRDDAHAAA
jgi:hypothetical protein